MRYLLDTCTFIWMLTDTGRLSKQTKNILKNGNNTLYFSAVSATELAIKKSIGKIKFDFDIQEVIEEIDLTPLPLSVQHGLALVSLPFIHKDPFDRMLIAQAFGEQLTILTADEIFQRYPISVELV